MSYAAAELKPIYLRLRKLILTSGKIADSSYRVLAMRDALSHLSNCATGSWCAGTMSAVLAFRKEPQLASRCCHRQ